MVCGIVFTTWMGFDQLNDWSETPKTATLAERWSSTTRFWGSLFQTPCGFCYFTQEREGFHQANSGLNYLKQRKVWFATWLVRFRNQQNLDGSSFTKKKLLWIRPFWTTVPPNGSPNGSWGGPSMVPKIAGVSFSIKSHLNIFKIRMMTENRPRTQETS